jgi:hypothetical protein
MISERDVERLHVLLAEAKQSALEEARQTEELCSRVRGNNELTTLIEDFYTTAACIEEIQSLAATRPDTIDSIGHAFILLSCEVAEKVRTETRMIAKGAYLDLNGEMLCH